MDRQRILLIFGVALLSATLLTWFLWAKTKAPQTEKTVAIVAAARDMPAGTRLKKPDLKVVRVPEKDLPKSAILDEKLAVDRALLYPVSANESLTSVKLSSLSGADGLASTIEPGKRAVSVQITDSTSAGGLIQPRSRVDVLFTRTGSIKEAVATTLLEDVVVLSIGRTTEVSQQAVDPRAPRPSSQTATLLVTPEQARRLELARNQGKISLALRNPLDRTVSEDSEPATALDLDPAIHQRLAARRQAGGVNIRDDRSWAKLIGAEEPPPPKPKEEKKEPPKPRFIIDVFRGDKHVQETFQ